MHRAVVLVALIFALAAPGGAAAVAAAPETATATGGVLAGADTGAPVYDPLRPPPSRPRVRQFAVSPRTLVRGASARLTLRIDGPTRFLRVRVDILRAGGHRARMRLNLGRERTGRRISRAWSPDGRGLSPGTYVARLHAVDTAGMRLRHVGRARLRVVAPAPKPKPKVRVAPTPVPAPAPVAPITPATGPVFPVQGPYSLGGEDARFGAARSGHIHQGHDISAAEGTPVITPLAGVVFWRAYQARGAGHYLVIRSDAGPDLVFMHLRTGSLTVGKGDRVTARQRIAEVGSTGASGGPHLHFEIWPDGWWATDSQPIDPLPQLTAWAAGS